MARRVQFYVESFDTVRLSSYRIAQSPFAHRYATDQTVYAIYCDRLYPLRMTNDEDPVPSYWKLRKGVLLYDVPEKPLEIAGPDAKQIAGESPHMPRRDPYRWRMSLRNCLQRRRDGSDGRRRYAARRSPLLVCQGERRIQELAGGTRNRP